MVQVPDIQTVVVVEAGDPDLLAEEQLLPGPHIYYIAFSSRYIYDLIFDACTPATMFRLGRTSQLGHTALKDYMKRAFDISTHFARFFTDPLRFRQLQAATDFVVSGSNALQLLNRDIYPDSDIDIYVNLGNASAVCEFLMNDPHRAYRFVPTEGDPDEFGAAWAEFRAYNAGLNRMHGIVEAASAYNLYQINRILRVFDFVSSDMGDDQLGCRRKVQVIVTELEPLISILTFHSTVVMNAITYKAAYSLYPKATFEDNRTLFTAIRESKHEHALLKYVDRGWDLVKTITPEEQADERAALRYGKRWVTDRTSWILPLDTSLLGPPEGNNNRVDPFSLGSFNLSCNVKDLLPEMRFTSIKCTSVSRSFVTNLELGKKAGTYVRVIEDLKKKGTIVPSPELCTEQIIEWSECCKADCSCTAFAFPSLYDQILWCPSFKEMKKKLPLLGNPMFAKLRYV